MSQAKAPERLSPAGWAAAGLGLAFALAVLASPVPGRLATPQPAGLFALVLLGAWSNLIALKLPVTKMGWNVSVMIYPPIAALWGTGPAFLATLAGAVAAGAAHRAARALHPPWNRTPTWVHAAASWLMPGAATGRVSQSTRVYVADAANVVAEAAAVALVWRLTGAAHAPNATWLGVGALSYVVGEGTSLAWVLPYLAPQQVTAHLGNRPFWTRSFPQGLALGLLAQGLGLAWGSLLGLPGVAAMCAALAWLSHTLQTMMLAATREAELQAAREAALLDPLTRLPNRRSLEEYAACLTEAALPTVVAIADADQFKRINDTWGHEAGDAVLRVLAERLQRSCRTGHQPFPDCVGRWGGEEFVLILPRLGKEAAAHRLEEIRRAVGATPILWEGLSIEVTCSVGAAAVETLPWELAEMVRKADQALYAAKRAGGDRTAWHGDPPPAPRAPQGPELP